METLEKTQAITRFGKFLEEELKEMSHDELESIILDNQKTNNVILQSDGYKLSHHLLYKDGIDEVYSYMEPRGGEMEYTVCFGLQYYLMKYLAGVRVTKEDIDEAHKESIKYFGFDVFDRKMWEHILNKHEGKLPIRIKAVPEGTVLKTKNATFTIVNTDPECASLTNVIETLIMKTWYTNTVTAYSRHIKELVHKYWKLTSCSPDFLIDYMVHCFGYRGASSEESASLGGAAHLINFKGSDTFGAIRLLQQYYGADMPASSVIASEHSVMESYGGKTQEFEAYKNIIRNVKEKCMHANPPSGVIILSLVSDTYNIYRVVNSILPALKDEFIGWKNANGISLKIVVRPDSGNPQDVLFGVDRKAMISVTYSHKYENLINRLAADYEGNMELAIELVEKGIFRILADQFGYPENSVNEKGYEMLHPQIGVLQGDGISLKTIEEIYERMTVEKWDTMGLVFGSGGKLLQAHDRDEQKYAIKATYVKINGKGIAVCKDPITDAGKKSKLGYLKLVKTLDGQFRTAEMAESDFESLEDEMVTVFENGEIKKFYTLDEIRKNAKI